MTDMKRQNVARLFGICVALSLITNLPSGFTNSSVNTAVEELRSFIHESYARRGWHISDTLESLIRSAIFNCWFVCQIIGSIASPYITDNYGRRCKFLFLYLSPSRFCYVFMFSIFSFIPLFKCCNDFGCTHPISGFCILYA